MELGQDGKSRRNGRRRSRAHGVLVTAVSPKIFRQAIHMLRHGGTSALVGVPPGDFPTPIFDVVLKGVTILGSIVGTRKDLQESLQFAAEGKVKLFTEIQPLEAINDVFDRLRHSQVNERVVLALEAT
jgi:propanol-preferring alcohol dehydrogenase